VPEQHLARIQGLNQTLNGGLNIVSAPLGALLLAILPMRGIIAIDVLTALFSIVPLFFIAIPQPQRQAQATKGLPAFWRSFRQELGDGLRYVHTRRGLVMLISMAVFVNFLLNPAFALFPLLITEHFKGGALQLGWIDSAFGAGIILGSWGGFRRRMVTSLCGLVLLGAGILVIGFTPSSALWLAIVSILTRQRPYSCHHSEHGCAGNAGARFHVADQPGHAHEPHRSDYRRTHRRMVGPAHLVHRGWPDNAANGPQRILQ